MPRIENAQRQFLLGSSFKGKQRNDGTSRRSSGNIRHKGSTQSETRSPPQTPSQPKNIPSHGIITLSHSSTLEELRKFQLDPRFTFTPRTRRHDPHLRHKECSSQFLR